MSFLSSLFLPKTIDPKLPKRLSDSQKHSWDQFFKQNVPKSTYNTLKDVSKSSKFKSRIDTNRNSHEVTTLVTIDSSDRDIYNYPSSSAFTIFPGKMFSRVTKVEVVSTAIPNLDTVITQYNNTLKWINEEDADIGYPEYEIVLSTGNYTLSNLVARLEKQLNDSKIKRRGGKGPPHVFDVSLNTDTGELDLYSYIARPLGSGAFHTSQGSSIITITLLNHGFVAGDVIRIIFLVDNIGGVAPQYFDSDLVLQTILDSSTFTVDLGVQAASTGYFGSLGAYVGTPAPFKILLGSSDTFMSKLGFPQENTSDSSKVRQISTVVGNITNIDFNVWPCKITTSSPLPISIGDSFNLINFDWGSNELTNRAQNGFIVASILDSLNFTTTFGLATNDGLNTLCSWTPQITRVGFNKFIVETTVKENDPGLNFRKLTRVDPGREISEVAFRCAVPHGLSKNDIVRISDTDSVPSVDGVYVVSEVYTPLDFTVNAFLREVDVDATLNTNDGINPLGNLYGKTSYSETSVNHKTYIFKDKYDTGPIEMTKPGKNGWINLEQSFELYGLPEFAGLNTGTLNGVPFDVKSISVSSSGFYQFIFNIPHQFPKESVSLDGTSIRLSSNSFGMSSVHKNNTAGQFNKGLFLHGEPYFFICSPSLTLPHNLYSTMSDPNLGGGSGGVSKHSSITTLTSSNVQNVLAILQLDNDQGKMVYDAFVTIPKQFNPPLRRIDDIKIELRTPRNQLADLQSLDWAFTLKIVEQIERS